MEELGPGKVFEKIGSEPTGRPFNSVLAVVDMPTHTGNPLVNAGAIATTSLISGQDAAEKWNKILAFYGKVAGDKLSLIDEVYKSEAATNAGNKALAMLLAKYDRIYADPFDSVDIYTKQCSVWSDCHSACGVWARRLRTTASTQRQAKRSSNAKTFLISSQP